MVEIYVNAAFATYVASFFGVKKGEATYAAFMDLNNDGVIDMTDIAAWAQKVDTWINVKPATVQEWFADRPLLLQRTVA